MKKLDPLLFKFEWTLPAVKCPKKQCSAFQKKYKNLVYSRPKMKNVLPSTDVSENNLIILLDPGYTQEVDQDNFHKFLEEHDSSLVSHSITLTYDNYTADEILMVVLPEDVDDDKPCSFETIGHIAHLNLRDVWLDYKKVIGQVILDKNAHIKTVVNKIGSIDETFRFFKMELLAGEDQMQTVTKEHGCTFEFDYSKVYWNSRLQTEHKRIVDLTRPGDTILDVFAGVGPFAIPLAKKGCTVYANDLNPESYKALIHNINLNKVNDMMHTSNLDGRQFLEEVCIEKLTMHSHEEAALDKKVRLSPESFKKLCERQLTRTHIIMNLPALAVTFLDVFKEKYDNFTIPLVKRKDIRVHCYCFSSSKDYISDAEKQVASNLGHILDEGRETHLVRRVGPNKVMLCVSFDLPWFDEQCVCNCETRDSTFTRKRVLEGGTDPMYERERKFRRYENSDDGPG